MSEYQNIVVKLDKIGKLPNSDSLSIVDIMGRPVIFKTGDFQPGDLACYISPDANVPTSDPRWQFLTDIWLKNHYKQTPPERLRIKCKRLRGVFSMGILTPVPSGEWKPGDDVSQVLNIEKWEPPIERGPLGETKSNTANIPTYTDIEGFRKYRARFEELAKPIILLEKIHGENARFGWVKDEFWTGSHHRIKAPDENRWYQTAVKMNLPEKFKEFEDLVFFGELAGTIPSFKYGLSEPSLFFYDIYHMNQMRYLNWPDVRLILDYLELPHPPIIYEGLWKPDLITLANGNSLVSGARNIREGWVAKPLEESWDPKIGRMVLKYVGEDFLLSERS